MSDNLEILQRFVLVRSKSLYRIAKIGIFSFSEDFFQTLNS